jgi:hypothetical protein
MGESGILSSIVSRRFWFFAFCVDVHDGLLERWQMA